MIQVKEEDTEQAEGRRPMEMTGGETRVEMMVGGVRKKPEAGGAR